MEQRGEDRTAEQRKTAVLVWRKVEWREEERSKKRGKWKIS